jgi:hypothetical protein
VLVEKAAQIRRDYGFSPPYFGDETNILDLLQQHEVPLGPRQLSLFEDWDADREEAPHEKETLADALAIEGLERLLAEAVEHRRQQLVAERRNMREQMEGCEGMQTAEWLQVIDDLSRGSFDMLTMTVYYPA